jgi:hypothetical protein
MDWEEYEEDGCYFDLEEEMLKGHAINEFDKNSTLFVTASNGDSIRISREEKNQIVDLEIANNAKFIGGLFSWYAYIDAIKDVVKKKDNIEIVEEHEDPNHYGVTVSFEEDSKYFNDLFQSIQNMLTQLDKEAYEVLKEKLEKEEKEFVGDIPFSVRKNKIKVNYDIINRKFWGAGLNIEEVLKIQHEIISKMPEVEIQDYQVEYPEGMNLEYELELSSPTTRKEAKKIIEGIKDEIKRKVIEKLKSA